MSQIARTIARALRLNESLTEAIAMGHDLGHTPFGHAGERALAKLVPGGFHHGQQSVRVVEVLEHDGMGLNLSVEVRDGILKHSKGKGPIVSDNPELSAVTLEGQIARIADIAAYVNHDLDDAIRAHILSEQDLPAEVVAVLGPTHSKRIGRLVTDAVLASRLEEKCQIRLSPEVLHALVTLRDVLFERVYECEDIRKEFERAERVISELWAHFHLHADEFHAHHWPKGVPDNEDLSRAVADFITGMTDRYALRTYQDYFLPRPWTVVSG